MPVCVSKKQMEFEMKRLAIILAMTAPFSVNCLAQQTPAELCVKDLEVIPGFLLENDTGAKEHLAQFGQKHFDDAFAEAKDAAMKVSDADGCGQVLNRYLWAWRKGHLEVWPDPRTLTKPAAGTPPAKTSAAPRKDEPIVQILSRQTILLTLKSFRSQNREPLIALLKRNHKALANHPNWIIDVRGNGGGSDSSYEPVLAWLLPDEMVSVGVMWLATPANLEGHRDVCAIAAPGDTECEKEINEVIALIRNAPTGSLVPGAPTGSLVSRDYKGGISFERQEQLEPRRPSRVAILIDGGCASSCENFLLAARQSFNVKLIGRRTYGCTDFGDMRPFALPSGQRLLWYATERSLRIPDLPVDLAGIPPDIYLPLAKGDHAKEEEVGRVQSWLEGGSMAPRKTGAESKPSVHN
jgi:hypothetical protein